MCIEEIRKISNEKSVKKTKSTHAVILKPNFIFILISPAHQFGAFFLFISALFP